MKKTSFLILSVISFLSINAQTQDWIWAKTASGINNEGIVEISNDREGNIFIAGSFEGPSLTIETITLINTGNSYHGFIAKYDPDGNALWARSIGCNDNHTRCKAIANDSVGNVIVCGHFYSDSIVLDTIVLYKTGIINVFIAKYDSSGNVLWAKSANGDGYNDPKDISIDGYGNIYILGTFTSKIFSLDTTIIYNTGNPDFFVAKIYPNGNVAWMKQITTENVSNSSICCDNSGGIVLACSFSGSSVSFGSTVYSNLNNKVIFLAKYDSFGTILWIKFPVGGINGGSNSIDIDHDGNILMTGQFYGPTITFDSIILTNTSSITSCDFFVAKFNSSGDALWARSAKGSYYESGQSVTTDNLLNIYVLGVYWDSSMYFSNDSLINYGEEDIFIVKYDHNGNLIWARAIGGTKGDLGNSIASDNFGNIFVAGSYQSSSLAFGSNILFHGGCFCRDDLFISKMGNTIGYHEWGKAVQKASIFPNPANVLINIKF
ncbi:SBBP repeat-containing protein, partial [Bacteroidota bacterium]